MTSGQLTLGSFPKQTATRQDFHAKVSVLLENGGGFKDTRGTLFFEIMRLAEARKPKYLFLENVRGLLSHDGGKTFGTILSSLWELGYDAEWQVLNSKDHGVPQNRERVFIIGHLGEGSRRKVFPIRKKSRGFLKTIARLGNFRGTVNDCNGISGTITANFDWSSGNSTKIFDNGKIRILTPLECWRLQGFPDWAFRKAKDAGISDTQLYKQAGNAISVPVVYEIAKRFKEAN